MDLKKKMFVVTMCLIVSLASYIVFLIKIANGLEPSAFSVSVFVLLAGAVATSFNCLVYLWRNQP